MLRRSRRESTQVAPAAAATVSLPFIFDWSDTANPQVPGYDLDVDTDPNFAGGFGVLFLRALRALMT